MDHHTHRRQGPYWKVSQGSGECALDAPGGLGPGLGLLPPAVRFAGVSWVPRGRRRAQNTTDLAVREGAKSGFPLSLRLRVLAFLYPSLPVFWARLGRVCETGTLILLLQPPAPHRTCPTARRNQLRLTAPWQAMGTFGPTSGCLGHSCPPQLSFRAWLLWSPLWILPSCGMSPNFWLRDESGVTLAKWP